MNPNLFEESGIHAIVDGQFGSTGKGALAAWLAFQSHKLGIPVDGSIYSGGPNSGHTFYLGGKKHVLKQVPTAAVVLSLIEEIPQPVYLSAGAIIDKEILFEEAERYPHLRIYVHPNAAVVSILDKETELNGTIAAVAGTRSGAGACLARKIARDPSAIWSYKDFKMPKNVVTTYHRLKPERNFYFMEVSQGFSLGINSEFYPKVTSRECTVMQGLADARIPPRFLAKTYMSIRTFPIRVGNVDGHNSGDWYPDQVETSWENLGVMPELTTVTKRERRVATFSTMQMEQAVYANDPDWVFINFLNYLNEERQHEFVENVREFTQRQGKDIGLILGTGPNIEDVFIGV
jgi:adenylosuccinate synthase